MPARVSLRLRNLCLGRYLLLAFCIPSTLLAPLRSHRAIARGIYNDFEGGRGSEFGEKGVRFGWSLKTLRLGWWEGLAIWKDSYNKEVGKECGWLRVYST